MMRRGIYFRDSTRNRVHDPPLLLKIPEVKSKIPMEGQRIHLFICIE